MKLTAVLSPIPLAFLIFPFAYALQVLNLNERYGLVPYVALSIGAFAFLHKAAIRKNVRYASHGIRGLDLFVCALLLLTTIHIGIGILLGGYGVAEGVRFFLIYVLSGYVYFYASRCASDTEIKGVMLAIAIAAALVAMDWVYETYTKRILLEVSEFQIERLKYARTREGTDEDIDLETSATNPVYRAYGLVETHTTTGATVAIGAFAMLALFPVASRRRTVLILGGFLAVLAVGGARLAFLSYLIVIPIVLARLGYRISLGKQIALVLAVLGILSVVLVVLALSTEWGSALVDTVLEQAESFRDVFEFERSSDSVSFFWTYVGTLNAYLDFLEKKPIAILFGEGPIGYGAVSWGRGGEVALLEMFAAYGVPMGIMFLVSCIATALRAANPTSYRLLSKAQQLDLLFGFAVLAFLLLSLAHYNTLFRKSIFVCFYFALGLIRRHAYGIDYGGRQRLRTI